MRINYRHKLTDELRAEDIQQFCFLDELVNQQSSQAGSTASHGQSTARLEAADICISTVRNFMNSAATEVAECHLPVSSKSISFSVTGKKVMQLPLVVDKDDRCQQFGCANDTWRLLEIVLFVSTSAPV